MNWPAAARRHALTPIVHSMLVPIRLDVRPFYVGSHSAAAAVATATVKAATASAATATVATAAATVATARATTMTTAMVAIHWDGAQRVVIKTAWMMPTRKRDDAYRGTCQDHQTQIGSIKKGTPHGTSYYEIFMLCFLHTACYVPGNSRRRHMASGQHNRRNKKNINAR